MTEPEPSVADHLLTPAIEFGRTGARPPEAAFARAHQHAAEIRTLSPARLREQLEAAICGHHPHLALQWIRDTGILVEVLPEVDATVAFSQEADRRHKDVWEHTKTVVRQAIPSPIVRWAALMHDIGKVPTRRFVRDGKVTFHGHAEEGARMFRKRTASRLDFDSDARKHIELLILYHLRAGQYEPSWTDSAVRRFAREMGTLLDDLLALSRADITSKRPGRRQHCLELISQLSERIRTLAASDSKVKPLPPGLGNALMEALELPPGRHLADLRKRLEKAHEAGALEPGRDAQYYVEYVRTHDLLAGIEIVSSRRA